jgi:hypothetical protein
LGIRISAEAWPVGTNFGFLPRPEDQSFSSALVISRWWRLETQLVPQNCQAT